MGFSQSISMANSLIRTVLATAVVGGISVGGWFGYQEYNKAELTVQDLKKANEDNKKLQKTIEEKDSVIREKDIVIEEKDEVIAEKQEEIDNLEIAIHLLKVDHRLAKIKVLETGQYPDGNKFSKVEFVEIDENGKPISTPQEFVLQGNEIRVDGLVVKFKDEYIEKADLLRGTTLFAFRQIYGNDEGPRNGKPLDRVGQRPEAYGKGRLMSGFEKKIWDDFWEIAQDSSRQEELGIRAIHGQANYVQAVKGKTYYVELRASGGATIRVTDEPAVPSGRPPA